MKYAQLHSFTHYSFLQSASHPCEIVEQSACLGYEAVAITDECSLAGIVKAHVAAKNSGIKLIVGAQFKLSNGFTVVVIAPNKLAYQELSGFITLARMRMPKGKYEAHYDDLQFRLKNCLVIFCLDENNWPNEQEIKSFSAAFKDRFWLGISFKREGNERGFLKKIYILSQNLESKKIYIPITVCKNILMHTNDKKRLLDIVYAIRENIDVYSMGTKIEENEEAHLYSLDSLCSTYPQQWLDETYVISELCQFSLDELRYQYPRELIPEDLSATQYLRTITYEGAHRRWPSGLPDSVYQTLEKELSIIADMEYEYFFITVYDLVCFAQNQGIFYQGRGSAANSIVCYCLFITEISPDHINVLFERFISKERDEPPDIDVDFENARREEIIQYIYKKYGRERAALAATVITYRTRSAIRDVGKALNIDVSIIEYFAKTIVHWDSHDQLKQRLYDSGLNLGEEKISIFFELVNDIIGFPRHLSQHVGGFIIAQDRVSDLVPQENAAMADRTVIQWDKDDLESLGLLKVDVLALGMLTALRKMVYLVNKYQPNFKSLADIPHEDRATYDLISRADTLGVFQIESRAQMTMLPRLQPRTFYDLVIEIAIVRPGPIMGDMVHPYLRRRQGLEKVQYESPELEKILAPTLGVPIFQEQVIRIAMVAAGFTGGEADELRRAMANWGKNSRLMDFEKKFIGGMLAKGYRADFAERIFEQVKGFGGYGFPESHSASFAILCYMSCWFKCHHPEAFYCALLNSLPMGFYSASQIIQDAQRHHIIFFPVDIKKSHWDNMLVKIPIKNTTTGAKNAIQKGIRLGFRNISGLQKTIIDSIILEREIGKYKSIQDLARRAQVSSNVLELLASADALKSLTGDRFNARWQASAIKHTSPLLLGAYSHHSHVHTQPSETQETLADYQTLGMTLKTHPIALLRTRSRFKGCLLAENLINLHSGQFVKVCGLITCRQRPGTAKGVMFLTLEDETGNINIVVWKALQEKYRNAILNARLIMVKGHVEISQSVVHIIAGHVEDRSAMLGELTVESRAFF